MKTPDEIKRGLECCAGAAPCKDCPYFNNNNAACARNKNRDALEYIQQLEAQSPRWISVEERLPEKPCSVLVNLIGLVNIAWYRDDETFETPSGVIFNREEVYHWMPLPAPTEGGRK